MVDALALGASGATHGGSSPLPRTKMNDPLAGVFYFGLVRGIEPIGEMSQWLIARESFRLYAMHAV